MIGELMHVKNTAFRMLPNPTVFYWDPNTFSLPLMVDEFVKMLKLHKERDSHLKGSSRVEKFLTPPPAERLRSPLRKLNYLHETIEELDKYLKRDDMVEAVPKVVGVHIEVVLGILNTDDDAHTSDSTKHSQEKDTPESRNFSIRTFENGSLAERHRLLTSLYMDSVRNNVVDTVYERMSNQMQIDDLKKETQVVILEQEDGASDTLDKATINEIWCTLVFRMLFWLQLHDFHQKDIQVSKSDLYGSRKPVYIV